jgi:hypothetical protein
MSKTRFVFYFFILITVYIAGAMIGIPGIEKKTTAEATRTADGNAADQLSAAVELPPIDSTDDKITELTGDAASETDLRLSVDDVASVDPPAGSSTVNTIDKAPPAIAERDQTSRKESGQFDDALQTEQDHPPLMIRWSNWQPDFGPALVYARENDLDGMLRLNGPVEKMLMVTSYEEAERVLTYADELRAAGVTIVGLNSEDGPEMTPHEDMHSLENPDPNENLVARVARLATQHGFEVIWGPSRPMADAVSDAALRTMMEAGMGGLALQEQKYIEVEPAQSRLAEVNRTRKRYMQLAQEQAVDDFTFHVQIMHERCPNLNNCVEFVSGLEEIPVDSIAIWSNGPIPPGFISAIRHS